MVEHEEDILTSAKDYPEEDESKESHKQELQESIVRKATGGFTAEIFGKPLGVEPLQEEDMIEIMKAVSNGMSLVQAEDSDATTKVRSRIADSSDEYPPKVDDVEAQRSEKENKVLDFCKNLRNFLGQLTAGGFGKMLEGSKTIEAYKLSNESLQYVKDFIPSVFKQEIGAPLSGQSDVKKEYVFATTPEKGEELEKIIKNSPGENFDVVIKAGNYLVVDLNGVKLTLVYPRGEIKEGV